MTHSLERRDLLVAGLAAGLTAAVTTALFNSLDAAVSATSPTQFYTYLASVAAGPSATGQPWSVAAGVVVLVLGSIGWAFGYLSAARRRPQLLVRPLISGFFFGLIVWCVNLLAVVVANRFFPTVHGIDRELLGSTVFFGVPLALAASFLLRRP